MRVAIYDLDKTLTRRATFTPFLLFAAWRTARWRVLLAPVWVALMAGYRLGLYDRTWLKTRGMRLMLNGVASARLEELGRDYACRIVEADGLNPAIMAMVEIDRARGGMLAIATAAFEFYAKAFAERIGAEHLIATRWDGTAIPGGNCYGEEKLRRVEEWLPVAREACTVFACSDSTADAPLLDWADEAALVGPSAKGRALARDRGWTVIDGARLEPAAPLA